ncbi:MAG: hypothetical protein NXI27_15840 [Alphaproteobacteria bacterium]|nr:hypothetical protein [Alphaproteobacteria bacterium]
MRCPSRWLVSAALSVGMLAAILAPASAASQEPFLKAEKIRELVTYFRQQAELARMVKNQTSADYYVSAFETEYFDNLIAVFEENAATLEKRERISEEKLTDYFASINEDLKAFVWIPELKKTVADHLKLIGTPGLDQERIETFYRQQRIDGEDPQLFYDRVARFSRPKAIELDETVLIITGGDAIDPRMDYWIDRSAPIPFTVTNTGDNDANGLTLDIQTGSGALDGVLGSGLSCNTIDLRMGTATCVRDVLETGAKADVRAEIRTDPGNRRLDEQWRAELDVSVRAASRDPEFQTEKRLTLTMRACVRAYDAALDPPLQTFVGRLDEAIAPNRDLPGKALYELPADKQYLSNPRDTHLNGEIFALITNLQINRGIDSDLRWLDISYGPYASLKTVALQLPRTLIERSRPSRYCQDPAPELAALRGDILPALRTRADEIRHYHRLLVLAANQRMQDLRFALEVGQEGTAEGETLEGATQELIFQTLETAMKDLAPYSGNLSTFLKMNAIARTASRGSTLLSFIEIFRASRALYYVLPEWWEPEYSLAMLEALPYMVELAERYEDLSAALEDYLNAIETAHHQACTCQDPF